MTRGGTVLAAYALLALLVLPLYPHFVSPNELSRWLLDASVIEHGTIEVTATAPQLGPRFEDLAVVGSRMYSNKAPGTNLLSIAGYAIARPFTRALRPLVTAERLTAATLPLLLLGLLFLRLAKRWDVEPARAATVLWVLFFATPLFAYGLLLFSHALVAAALFGAWYFLYEERRDFVAGALIGLAVAAEYPMAIPAAILLAPIAGERRILRAIAGGLPFAAALAAYHTAAFGGPFRNPYAFSKLAAYRELAEGGFLGIRAPSIVNLGKLLADPAYGLLVFAPVLLLALPALVAMRKNLTHAAWWTLALTPLSILILYAGYPYWHGGWNVGPRYLVPAIPFLVAPLLFRKSDLLESLLSGWSALAVALTTLVFPFVPQAFAMPWMSLAAPLLRQGLVAPNLAHLLARPVAIAVPFAIVLVAAIVASRPRLLPFLAVGIVAAVLVGREWPADRERTTIQRAYIAAVYFERHGALGSNAPPQLLRRRELELTLPPPSWPF
ncbi:MAG: hypothetical protein QOH21_3664 [Acidobacteriota bacterium]|jgi:hypothetical protein|nr:hypothetical protein [Acidobacteriota bacterium]